MSIHYTLLGPFRRLSLSRMPSVNLVKTLLRDDVVFHWKEELLEIRQVCLLEINLQLLVEEAQRC